MKVILKEHVAKLGRKLEVVDVADGYALNFLIPQGRASLATDKSLASLETLRGKIQAEEASHAEAVKDTVRTLEGKTITLTRSANDHGHLFAKISRSDIATALSETHSVEISDDLIDLSNPIKEVGEYTVPVKYEDTLAKIAVVVEKE